MKIFVLDFFDFTLITRRPVDWEPFRHLFPGGAEPTIYPGSIISRCKYCRTPVYVGPRQQGALTQAPLTSAVACFACAARAHNNPNYEVTIADLGNPFQRRT